MRRRGSRDACRTGEAPSSSPGRGCAARSRSQRRSPYPSRPRPAPRSPDAALILFLTFSVILATLVGMGLTMPLVIRARARGRRRRGARGREGAHSRRRSGAGEARGARAGGLGARRHRRTHAGAYRFRTTRFRARLDDGDDGAIESRSQDYQRLRRELLDAEREALSALPAERCDLERRLAQGGTRPRPRRPAPRHLSLLLDSLRLPSIYLHLSIR